MSDDLESTRQFLQRHHGGDGHRAAERTVTSHGRNHDEDFWAFWDKYTPRADNRHVADLGCGPALFLKQLAAKHPGYTLTGIEIAPYMLARIDDKPHNLDIRIADLNAPGEEVFPPASIDACLANMLVHELFQPVILFQRLHRWIKPGGLLVLTDNVRQPLENFLHHRFPDTDFSSDALSPQDLNDSFRDYFEHNRYTADELVRLLELCGFEPIEQQQLREGRALRIAARNR
ncbi:class I SAM-dependent methyltransferase [Marinobacterium lutimaris]|uniref:Methyltransferase domain-containing protein n=1 Tax=Marinobacterium lutimaris TaxID=568106 RepID=A0A1H5XRS5_9GAMM|nr:class I SAM-dependent methyltransferase [Marinobacterium lutimaris]SEG14225.1 Methyltransferase domain-containing protein [Marinobacterium lutimaris]